jgi:3-oxoacyl-[acyl-carrier protein] reductase
MVTLLKDKTVIVTGGASGMGRSGAELFARHGANVVIADINGDGATEVASTIEGHGGVAKPFQYDATRSEASKALVESAVDTFGALHGAWANAGLAAPFSTIEDYDENLFDRLMAVNIKGPWLLAKHAIGALEATSGSFLITASLSGLKGRANHSGYQASKGGAVMLTRALAKEFAPRGVRANSLCPVAADTPMLPLFVPEDAADLMDRDQLKAGIPMGRLATADDVAQAALFFLSDLSCFVTGVTMPIDGGTAA